MPALAVAGAAAHAQETACDDLPESEQTLCRMVQACGTLPDEARRQECYRIAARTLGDEADAPPAVEAQDEADPPATPSAVDAEAQARPTVAAPQESEPDADADHTQIEEQVVAAPPASASAVDAEAQAPPTETPSPAGEAKPMPPASALESIVATTVERTTFAIPKRFTAEVTRHQKLVGNRQLLVLDGKLLFEGDNAATSRIKPGQQVDVVKVSSFRGRRYQITGPSKRAFMALRIRCELSELGSDNRRKCRVMFRDAE